MSKRNFKASIRRSRLLRFLLYVPIASRRYIINRSIKRKKSFVRELSQCLAEDPVIKVKEFGGQFVVDARSDLFSRIAINHEYEPELVEICSRFLNPSKDVIDVGANIGFYTVFFARKLNSSRVLAIEPTVNTLRRLKHNIKLNGIQNSVIVFEGLAGDVNGITKIKIIEGREEFSTSGVMRHPSIKGDTWSTSNANCATVDYLVEEHCLRPGLIKIDVEGTENSVIKGALQTLKVHRPIIISELSNFLLNSNGSSASEVLKTIGSMNYDIFDPLCPFDKPGQLPFGDIVCFPKEMGVTREHLIR